MIVTAHISNCVVASITATWRGCTNPSGGAGCVVRSRSASQDGEPCSRAGHGYQCRVKDHEPGFRMSAPTRTPLGPRYLVVTEAVARAEATSRPSVRLPPSPSEDLRRSGQIPRKEPGAGPCRGQAECRGAVAALRGARFWPRRAPLAAAQSWRRGAIHVVHEIEGVHHADAPRTTVSAPSARPRWKTCQPSP